MESPELKTLFAYIQIIFRKKELFKDCNKNERFFISLLVKSALHM